MTPFAAVLLAAIAVAPADRLAMADRLFGRGDYAGARAEYAALKGDGSLAGDDVLHRLAECDRMLGRLAEARAEYGELLSRHPASRHAERARLMRALAGTDDEKRSELRALDSDRVDPELRAVALYHLGVLDGDGDALDRCVKLAPKGRYAPYAKMRRASSLASSEDRGARRKAVGLLLEIAFGGEGEFAEEALYLAATTCYGDGRRGEAASLLRRYMKTYPKGRHAAEARSVCAWCDYLSGKYADAVAMCGDGPADDTCFLLAAATHASGDARAAKPLYERYLERFPVGRYRRDAELSVARIGFVDAEKSGDAAAAVECARRAAALSSLAADRLRVAWAYEKAERPEDAVREYAAVARDFPGSAEAAEAMFRKALADLREERWAAADLALAESLSSGKLDAAKRAEALYWRGVACIRLGHAEEGAARLREAEEAGLSVDRSREARLLVADCDYAAGRVDAAKAAYAKLVGEGAAERMSASKTLAVGKLLFPGDEARICAAALLKGDAAPWRQAGYALLGAVEERAGNFAAAMAAYRSCMAEDCTTEDLPRAAARLGALEAAAGEWDAAEATLKRAVELNGADVAARAECYLHLAEVSAAKGDSRSARAYATVVTTLFEGTPFAAGAAEILKAHPGEEAGS